MGDTTIWLASWHERRKISTNLSRARVAGAVADLTVEEWTAIVQGFKRKCAYCRRRPYQNLEHFVPISQGGGTTASNCVPACAMCNAHRSQYLRDQLDREVDLKADLKREYDRVGRYLAKVARDKANAAA